MSTNAAQLVPQQVPEFIKNDYPLFIQFLQAYYEFLEQYSVDILNVRDKDLSPDTLVSFLRSEFLRKFPRAMVDDRRLIGIINEIYKAKGTHTAIELLFRVFFNKGIILREPNKNILRASDGKWIRENSISLKQVYIAPGYTLDVNDNIVLTVENDAGIFFLEVTKALQLSADKIRFSYNNSQTIVLEPDQTVDIVDALGVLMYRGQVLKEPAEIVTETPGKFWQLGQVFLIPSNEASGIPTIGVVTRVSPTGGVLGTKILQYGTGHTENQVVLISPFSNKPAGSSYDLETTITSYNPISETYTYNYTLTLGDYCDALEEEFYISSDIQNETTYFLEDYVERGFIGTLEVYQKTNSGTSSTLIEDPTITIEDWIASRAQFRIKYDYAVKYAGAYINVDGQVSSPEIKLQDNYFYQLFSYAIESSVDLKEYKGILEQIHPAGLKFFADLAKIAVVTFGDTSVSRVISNEKLFRDDAVTVTSAEPVMHVYKVPDEEFVNAMQSLYAMIFNKVVPEPVSLEEYFSNSVTKNPGDLTLTAEELISKEINKVLGTENISVSETLISKTIDTAVPEELTVSDTGVSSEVQSYNEESYFGADYTLQGVLLTIG